MVTVFRWLIVGSAVIYSFYYWMPFFDLPFYSQEARNVLALDGFDAAIVPGMTFGIVFFAVWIALRALMFYFVHWARVMFALLCLAYPLVNFALGIRVAAPIEMVMLHFVTITDGALLAMAYLTSVSTRFGSGAAKKG